MKPKNKGYLIWSLYFLNSNTCQGRCTSLLLYFNTNKSHSFFLQNTSCIRKPLVISRGGGPYPLHPPPRSAPACSSSVKGLPSLFCFRLGRKIASSKQVESSIVADRASTMQFWIRRGFLSVLHVRTVILKVNHHTLLLCSSWPYVLFYCSIRPYCCMLLWSILKVNF